MKTTDITSDFRDIYHPKSALLFYETVHNKCYTEYFDIDEKGNPINAHPLTVNEAAKLAASLTIKKDKSYLTCKGLLPQNILFINTKVGLGSIVWFTKAQYRQLYFAESLAIPSDTANIPALIWKATDKHLTVYALKNNRRPTEKTILYHAPFFNMYESGNVCMGTVEIDMIETDCIEQFILGWESLFFNSYFSHLIDDHNPIQEDCAELWKNLIATKSPFPTQKLKQSGKTLKNLLK